MIYWMQQDERQHTVLTKEGEQTIVERPLLFLLNQWCTLHGSTLEGRRKAACANLYITQKAPILVSEITRDIFFPTSALRNQKCIWINYRAVSEILRQNKKTRVIFRNGSELIVSLEIRAIKRSMRLCEQYLVFLTQLHRSGNNH